MMNSGFLDFAANIQKLEHFEGVGFRIWQKKMKFLLAALNVAYVLITPKPIRHHGMNMDDSIAIASIIDKLPPSWNKVCNGPHFKKDCEVWKEKMQGISSGDHGQGSGQWKQGKIINLVSDSTENFIAMISEVYVMQTDDSWWVDTGATRHVCKDMNLYKSYKNLEDGPSLYMGNDSMVKHSNSIRPSHPLHPIFFPDPTLLDRRTKSLPLLRSATAPHPPEDERAGIRMSEIVIAYDPVWEIGTGKVATPAHAQEFGTSCCTFNFFTSAL
nr:uncharacterized protein LOC109192662 [Ipomoea trifida]